MAIHAEARDLAVATTEFRETLGALGIAQHRVARLFGVGPRSVRRWQDGDRRVPCGVGIVLRHHSGRHELTGGGACYRMNERPGVPVRTTRQG